MPPPSSFEQIVREHQGMVFRTLARLLGTRAPAGSAAIEDLAQDVFLRLHRALPAFRGEAELSTYLYRIAVNVANTEAKRRRRPEFDPRRHISLAPEEQDWEARLPHPAPNAAEQMLAREFADSVDQHLARLNPVERAVLVLYHQEERSYSEIGAILSLPLGTVRTHLHRGRNKLRAALARPAEGSPTP